MHTWGIFACIHGVYGGARMHDSLSPRPPHCMTHCLHGSPRPPHCMTHCLRGSTRPPHCMTHCLRGSPRLHTFCSCARPTCFCGRRLSRLSVVGGSASRAASRQGSRADMQTATRGSTSRENSRASWWAHHLHMRVCRGTHARHEAGHNEQAGSPLTNCAHPLTMYVCMYVYSLYQTRRVSRARNQLGLD